MSVLVFDTPRVAARVSRHLGWTRLDETRVCAPAVVSMARVSDDNVRLVLALLGADVQRVVTEYAALPPRERERTFARLHTLCTRAGDAHVVGPTRLVCLPPPPPPRRIPIRKIVRDE